MGGDIISSAGQARILVIEEEGAPRSRVVAILEEAGLVVTTASDVPDGLKKLYESYPDLVIMASESSVLNGGEPFFHFRQTCYLPILVIGSKEEAAETLELGADAYITKPPSPYELVARVRALLRRKPRYDPPEGIPKLEIENRLPKEGNRSSGLTPTEFRLASCLMLNKDRLLDYPRLISEVWGGRVVTVGTLHFYMRRLRQKLGNGGIFMLRGVGYCFKEDQVPLAAM